MVENLLLNKILLSNFTTYRIGGPAEWFAEPRTSEEINELIIWAQKNKIKCNILGAGSNLLVNDKGVKGLTICMRKFTGSKINSNTGIIEVFGGETIPSVARYAAKAGLHGLEWSIGIPGSIGGAITMNAGAQGGCISDNLLSIKVMPINGKKSFTLKKNDLEFSYRNSLLQQEELIVLSACFKLEPGHETKKINAITNKNLHLRTHTQPYNLPSCGSVFRNPERIKAGQMIEQLGLKGLRIGGAEISTIHANFIVNIDHASSKDIEDLISITQKKAMDTYGVVLKSEVKKLGFDSKDIRC